MRTRWRRTGGPSATGARVATRRARRGPAVMARRKRTAALEPEPLPIDVSPEDLVDPRACLVAAMVGTDHDYLARTPDERLAWAREHASGYVRTPDAVRVERVRVRENLDRLRVAP